MSEYSLKKYLGRSDGVRNRCGKGDISLKERLTDFYKPCNCKPKLGGSYAKIVNDMKEPGLVGLVDMHTHLAAHLGFGKELFYGTVDDKDPAVFFNSCTRFHGSFFEDMEHANEIRCQVVNALEDNPNKIEGWNHVRAGYPDFRAWPTWHDRTHQKMRIEWLERAWRGGLRVIVALTVNSHILAVATHISPTPQPNNFYDDRSTGDEQIAEIYRIANNSSFMKVVKSAAELRETVRQGLLAVIIGTELDCIGNFYKPALTHNSGAAYNPNPTDQDVVNEIQRLYNLGVRYFFPVHLTDNVFGGTAVYEDFFDAANWFQFGNWMKVEAAPAESEILHKHGSTPVDDFLINKLNISLIGRPAPCNTTTGHRNARGLQDKGKVALRELMRLGVMIDIDHMSERTVRRDPGRPDYPEGVLDIAEKSCNQYPICSGHGHMRSDKEGTKIERLHHKDTVGRLLELNGTFGIGLTGKLDMICNSIREFYKWNQCNFIAFGSDCNGLERLTEPRYNNAKIVYRDDLGASQDALEPCKLGNRRWDYGQDGMPHIGLYPDMIEEIVSSGLLEKEEIEYLFRSAEYFATTWEICEARSRSL